MEIETYILLPGDAGFQLGEAKREDNIKAKPIIGL